MRPDHREQLPALYPILDAEALRAAGISLDRAAEALFAAGVRWVQYRDKLASDAEVVARMRRLRAMFPAENCVLLLNDRVHLCADIGADGVHVGQEDLPPEQARQLIGPEVLLGVSTHNVDQMRTAVDTGVADYLAIGPVFATGSKRNPDPVVGLDGVRAARAITRLPLVAIGGITRETAAGVLAAGADAVAVISGLLPTEPLGSLSSHDSGSSLAAGETIQERVRDFLSHLR